MTQSIEPTITPEPTFESTLAEMQAGSPSAPAPEPNSPDMPSLDQVLSDLGGTAVAPPAAPQGEGTASAPSDAPEAPQKKYEAYIQNVVRLKAQLRQEKQAQKEQTAQQRDLIEQGRKFEQLMALKQADPSAFIEAVALDPNAVVQKMVADLEKDHALTPAQQQERLLAEVEAKVERKLEAERERIRVEAEARHKDIFIQQTITNYQNAIATALQSNPEKYEMINTLGAQAMVWSKVMECFQRYDLIPTPAMAADVVEEYLTNEATKFMSTKRYQQLAGKATANHSNGQQSRTQPTMTLTNNSAKASAEIVNNNDLDENQAFEEALKLITLK